MCPLLFETGSRLDLSSTLANLQAKENDSDQAKIANKTTGSMQNVNHNLARFLPGRFSIHQLTSMGFVPAAVAGD